MSKRPLRLKSLPHEPRKAITALAGADPVMAGAIAEVGAFGLPARTPDLHMLVSCVIGQSISIRAAEKIVERFSRTVGDRGELHPGMILTLPEEAICAVGLTRTKARAIRAIAELWDREKLTAEAFAQLPDEAVHAMLTALHGVGPWTAKMFLIFGLRRPDVLPHEDLGLREAVMHLYGLKERPGRAELEALAEKWRPWRTVGTVYAWQYLLKQRNVTLTSAYGWW